MDTVRKACRGPARPIAGALAVAAVALTAGCAAGAHPSRPVSAHPVAVTSTAGTSSAGAGNARPVPSVFAASFAPARPGRDGDRLALLSSRTGRLLRWLTPPSDRVSDKALSVRGNWVYFVRNPVNRPPGRGSLTPAIWRVRTSGGQAQLVQAGAADYAVSPDGRAVAYVTSTDRTVEIVGRNLATGRRNTIVLDTRPDPRSNNWPPEVSGLTWAGDDAHLAVQFELTAAISSVLTFGAFTATTISDGRTGPPPCPAATHDQCEESHPAYLVGGALSYVIQRLSQSGATQASLVGWRTGQPATTLLSFPGGPPPQSYDMTAQGQAIWASGPARPKGPWTVWRWSGGTPVKITTLPALGSSPYYGVGALAW